MTISQTLISWYHQHKRNLPWRSTTDPYKIWLSEVILQQTRVSQGMDYYYRFLERFPDVFSLASAEEQDVLKLWQGLGYYSRARNLHHAAKTVVQEYGGQFPRSYEGLLKLKGIGEYTAAAIASIAFDIVVPVIDGNVARVLSRIHSIEEPVNSPAGMKRLRQIASELIPANDPATFNQAIMEFGALHCKPSNPECRSCPLRLECSALKTNSVAEFPRKIKASVVKELFFYYLVIQYSINDETFVLLNHRQKQGIWKNLYDFPLIESSSALEVGSILDSPVFQNLIPATSIIKLNFSSEYIHLLSHRKITAQFIRIDLDSPPANMGSFGGSPVSEVDKYPVSRLVERYLEEEWEEGREEGRKKTKGKR
ncbi:MAG: A/G-specific adenine glycosylase [Bacteroidetes bacterium]|nr:A/G-specific adenine glycosylase [Bacteroidota bacterium]